MSLAARPNPQLYLPLFPFYTHSILCSSDPRPAVYEAIRIAKKGSRRPRTAAEQGDVKQSGDSRSDHRYLERTVNCGGLVDVPD